MALWSWWGTLRGTGARRMRVLGTVLPSSLTRTEQWHGLGRWIHTSIHVRLVSRLGWVLYCHKNSLGNVICVWLRLRKVKTPYARQSEVQSRSGRAKTITVWILLISITVYRLLRPWVELLLSSVHVVHWFSSNPPPVTRLGHDMICVIYSYSLNLFCYQNFHLLLLE